MTFAPFRAVLRPAEAARAGGAVLGYGFAPFVSNPFVLIDEKSGKPNKKDKKRGGIDTAAGVWFLGFSPGSSG